jgi:predicted methyltransferase
MPKIPSFEAVRELGEYLVGTGYDLAHVGGQLDLDDLPHGNENNRQILHFKTSGETPIHVLTRLFHAGEPVEIDVCRRVLPIEIVAHLLETEMVRENGGRLEPVCALIPFRNLLIACDGPTLRKGHRDVVLGPSASTDLVSRFNVGGPSAATLDFGTGSGYLALEAASYSDNVVATDVNPRAIEFTNFNAALNGTRNVTAIPGDFLEPVTGREFTRIIANPPFFLTPTRHYTYSDSPLELDGFCRALAREAPAYLSNGGFFQMTAEWVQIKGQPWQARLQEWMESGPCDAMAITVAQFSPVRYTERRVSEMYDLIGSLPDGIVEQRMKYFTERNVELILGGVITMRKRSGANWFVTLPCESSGFVGAAVLRRFQALDYLGSHSEADILEKCYAFVDGVALNQKRRFDAQEWHLDSITMTSDSGFGETLRMDDRVANFIPLFDGKRTVAEVAAFVSSSLSWPIDMAHQRCIALTRRLLQSGYIQESLQSGS